jgi:hypothetical protein
MTGGHEDMVCAGLVTAGCTAVMQHWLKYGT